MPELPEVETVVRGLRPVTVGRVIQRAVFPAAPGRMCNLDADALSARIAGQPIRAIARRAKYLLFQLEPDTLIVHLKMTGHLYVVPEGASNPFDRWLRVAFPLDDRTELRFSDSRRFGRVYVARDAGELLPRLGPEPLDDAFTPEMFRALLKRRAGRLKSLLLDQSFVAGIGNIYADEALHIARLHPLRTASSLTDEEIARLYTAIRQALYAGLGYEGASIGWYRKPDGERGAAQEHFRAYRTRETKDLPCPVCGGPIMTIRVGQRGTHFCPTCQADPG
ncbi:MAG: bifunctional DNA-formamidopyrimidine glycosylase/DNA-(apurinic or apyrimidinic site) lyase [Anaerolineae bacterium]|nr:bifunctional DNA-formamidopyrimidine glycosylase/DNA-(apurinic or apyrimidinic site) lyase [Anaerolineae bacterium]